MQAYHQAATKGNHLDATRPEHVKTNFDDFVFEELGAAGIGVVVRNSSGEVLAAMSNPSAIDHSYSGNIGSSTSRERHRHSHREEVIVKIDYGDSSKMKSSEIGGKIWRENSYEYWKGQDKSGFDFVRCGSGGQNSNTMAKEEKEQPSKLIKQFLHKQKASGKMLLDMDLEMDELRDENDRKLPLISESPPQSDTLEGAPSVVSRNQIFFS